MMEVRKSGILWTILLMLIVVLFCTFTQGKTIYVDTDGLADFDNIQAGINASVDGDTVLVADGTYTGDGNRDLDFNGKAITVTSENGAEATIIDCQGRKEEPHRGFYFHSGETLSSVVDGFTVKNGYGPVEPFSSSIYSVGGGIYCTNSSPTITNNIITGNTAEYGGGIQCWEYSSPRITNNVITRNSSGEGAGIYCYKYCSATISNNTITENIAGWGGGGVKIDLASSAEVVNNVIAENSAQWKGGGIYCGNSSPVIVNNTLAANNSQHEGGGIYIWGNASPLIVNTILWGDNPEEIVLGGGSSFIITYSCVQGGWPGAGNIDADPLFLDAANADYRLQDGSPCINAGDNSAIPQSLLEDIDGNPRITDGIMDMGAYEFGMAAIPDEPKYSGGTGEPNNPYQIATAEDLMLLGNSPDDYDKHFVLTADIDLDPNLPGRKVFDRAVIAPDMNDVSMEFDGIPFTGVFDGNGRVISYLTIAGESYLGLFGQLGLGAMVSNLGLEVADVNGTGIFIGGLVGWNAYGSISASYSTGMITGDSYYVGGLVGMNENGNIAASYSTGAATGFGYVGGLVGSNEYGSIITSYSTGHVTGVTYIGGLVGWNGYGGIAASYSTGTATGFEYVGGLVGNSGGSITTSYSTGVVSGGYNVGGLVGGGWLSATTASFWNVETSGQTTSDGGMGLATDEMQDISTYLNSGWDFVDEILNGTCDYWKITPGEYPRSHYHIDESPVMPEGLGTIQQPYLIRDARDLGTMWFKPMAHYRLETSVELSGIAWSMAPIPWFGGTFEGSGHTISHLTIKGGSYLGLFRQLSKGANVSNLGLEAVDINGTGDSIGGLVGLNNNGNITASYSTGAVTGYQYVGGLVGWNRYGNIIASYSNSTVTGRDHAIGALVGWIFEGNITSSYGAGIVSGDYEVGGLVGWNGFGSITASYSTATTSGAEWFTGGLVGLNYGNITKSYNIGTVKGNEVVGGLVGYNDDRGNIIACFWDIESSGLPNMCGSHSIRATCCDDSFGKTTLEMQVASTFLEAGWDFVDETDNGTEDIWWILEGQDYPRLWWEPSLGLIDDVTPDIDLVISNPIPDERFVRGEDISFSVIMSGEPDLDGLQLEWTSDKDGVLGTGLELKLDNLSTGSHVIEVCGYGACASISVRIYEDLWQLYQSPPAEGEIERILNDFSFNLIDGEESDEKWDTYAHVFDQSSTDPSFLAAISKIDMLRRQRFSKPVPFTDGQTIYDHFKTYVKTINLKLDCSYNSAGGDQVNLNRNFSVWDGRVSGTPSDWDACKTPLPNHSLYQYTNPIGLLMHEVRHCEPSDPGHRMCNGRPSDEMLEDGGGYAQSALYLMWVYKYSLYDPLFIRNEARFTATMLLKERICTTPTHSDPNVQAIIDELLN